jgi:hypothetical protein
MSYLQSVATLFNLKAEHLENAVYYKTYLAGKEDDRTETFYIGSPRQSTFPGCLNIGAGGTWSESAGTEDFMVMKFLGGFKC